MVPTVVADLIPPGPIRHRWPPQSLRLRPLRPQLYSITAAVVPPRLNRRRPPRPSPCQPFRTKNSPSVTVATHRPWDQHRGQLAQVLLLSLIRKIPHPFHLPLWEQRLPLRLLRCIISSSRRSPSAVPPPPVIITRLLRW